MTMTENQTPEPGMYFETPGIAGGGTQFYYGYEPTEDLALTPSGTAQVTVNGIQQFTQTDVVLEWMMEIQVAGTWTEAAEDTVVLSQYAPYNLVGPVKVTIQNQFSPVDVESGIDLYIFNIIRTRFRQSERNNLGYNPAGAPAGGTATGYPTDLIAQPNLVAPGQFAVTSGAEETVTLFFRIPASTMFDVYSDLAGVSSANVASNQGLVYQHCYVSPQYMGGTVRNVIPKVKLNAFAGTQADENAVFGAGAPTYADDGSTITFRRFAIYNNNDPTVLPPQFAWQTTIATTRLPFNGVQKQKFLIPQDAGQILSCYLRMWDPAATNQTIAGAGAPIALTALTRISFSYATGVFFFDGTPQEWQDYWLKTNGLLLPPGVFAFDFARMDNDLVTNANCYNTLTTSTIQVSVELEDATSPQAYAVLGVEALSLVSVS